MCAFLSIGLMGEKGKLVCDNGHEHIIRLKYGIGWIVVWACCKRVFREG